MVLAAGAATITSVMLWGFLLLTYLTSPRVVRAVWHILHRRVHIMADQVVGKRDQIRAAFFGQKVQHRLVPLENGLQVEVRQPTVGNQLELAEAPDSKQRMARLLIGHCYVPGTDELIFGEADYAGILAAPAGGDYAALIEALTDLMKVKEAVKAQGKN